MFHIYIFHIYICFNNMVKYLIPDLLKHVKKWTKLNRLSVSACTQTFLLVRMDLNCASDCNTVCVVCPLSTASTLVPLFHLFYQHHNYLAVWKNLSLSCRDILQMCVAVTKATGWTETSCTEIKEETILDNS